MMYVCQLDKKAKLEVFKRIKAILIAEDCLTYENLRNALDSKVKDLF